jgi:serine/threonine protein kinase
LFKYVFDDVDKQHPDPFYVTGKDLYIPRGEAGQGAQSSAFFVVQISLDDGQTKNMLIKVAQKAFKTEQDKLDFLSPNSKASKNIDHFKGAYKIQNNSGYIALFEASRSDFTHIDYKNVRLPVLFVFKQLLSVADGIASFHRADLVLRDIKGANLLANWKDVSGEEGQGKVTDFGLMKELSLEGTQHKTAGTPTYMAPYIWDNIINQKLRKGFQGKEADLFALGRTIQYDVIVRLLDAFGGVHVNADIRTFIKPHAILLQNMADKDLLVAYEQNNLGHVFCRRV